MTSTATPRPATESSPADVLLPVIHRTASGSTRRGPRNIRRHWGRATARVVVLVASDTLAVLGLGRLSTGVGSSARPWGSAAEWFAAVFPAGLVGSWQLLVALLVSLAIAGAYRPGHFRRDKDRVAVGVMLGVGLVLYTRLWVEPGSTVAQFVGVTIAVSAAIIVGRIVIDGIVTRFGFKLGPSRAVLVSGAECVRLEDRNQLPDNGPELHIVDRVDTPYAPLEEHGQSIAVLDAVIAGTHADTVIISGQLSALDFAHVVDTALASGCRLLAGSRSERLADVRALWIEGRRYTQLTVPSLKAWQLFVKRAIDIVGAGVGLVLLSPLFAVIAVWVRATSPGPVIFAQERVGAGARIFRFFKFRSMRPDAEDVLRANGELYRKYVENEFKLPEKDDPRLTTVGRFLRKTSLDELPQLVNVLVGQMSLVGPRPITAEELDRYDHGAPLFLSLRPGMTGLWAVSGRRTVGYPDRRNLELEYVRRWSLFLDLSILFRTMPEVLKRRGAH